MAEIDDKYAQLGGASGPLGPPVGAEFVTADGIGRGRHYQLGSIYWLPGIGAHEVHGAIRNKWSEYGLEQGLLGYPLTDETTTPGGVGRFNHFQTGSIYWTPATGAHEVHGAIRNKWQELGWEQGILGYPLTDETATPDRVGRFNHFQGLGGSIYWHPATGRGLFGRYVDPEPHTASVDNIRLLWPALWPFLIWSQQWYCRSEL